MLSLLRKKPNFHALFWTQFLGALNDNIFKNALVILITYHEATILGLKPAAIVALAGGIFILPFFLFSAWSGEWAEKHSRVQIAQFVKWFELGIMLICSFGFFFHHFEFLLVGLFLMGVHSTLFGPIKYSLVPAYVEDGQLNAGNAYVEAGTFFAILFGTILGGWSAAQNEWVILALLVGISCLGLFSSYKMSPVPIGDPHLKMDKSWLKANKKLLSVLKSVPGSLPKIIGLSWFWGLGAAALAILPPYAKDIVMADENVVTLFLATFTIGIALGAGIVPLLLRWRSADHVVRIGGLLMSIALIDWAFLKLGAVPFLKMQVDILGDISSFSVTTLQNYFYRENSVHLLLDLLMLAAGGGLYTVPQMTAIQQMTPANELSRMIAANNIINAVFIVTTSILLMALYALKLNYAQILLTLGVLNALIFIGLGNFRRELT